MNSTNKCLHAFTCITFAWLFGAAIVSAAETLEPFLEKHCLRCHGPEKEKGELRIDQLSRVFKTGIDGHHWAEIVERINA
ncbi:MAG: c-type cytochrome domain-containing protein, partial [Verrucomicrobiales bacterium]